MSTPPTPALSHVDLLRRDQDAEDELRNAIDCLKRAVELSSCKWHRANLAKAIAKLEQL